MFMQENQSSSTLTPNPPESQKSHRKMYAATAALALIAVVAGSLLATQDEGATMALSLNFNVGEHMVYQTKTTATNQMANATLDLPGETTSQNSNSTITIDVIAVNGEDYKLNETIKMQPALIRDIPPSQ